MKTGSIVYDLWTVAGTIKLNVNYEIEEQGDSEGIGNISIEPIDPEVSSFPINLDDEMEEIISQCVQDFMEHRKEDQVHPKELFEMEEEVKGYVKACKDFDFSVN